MSPWLRLEPGRRENAVAAATALAAATSVGVIVFYFGRILISREKVSRTPPLPDAPADVDGDRRAPSRDASRRS